MTVSTKTRSMKWAWLPGVFLMSAALIENAPAQEQQRRQDMRQRQQQDQELTINRSPFPDDLLENLLVIRLAERSNVTGVVEAKVKEGVATLSGKVPDRDAERRALRIARATPGIMSVRDEIGIDASMTRAISKTERKVGEKELEKQVAEKIAAAVQGAKAGEDWWFEGWRVEGQHNAWNLVVEVDEPGFVVLEGEVPSLDIMRQAVEAAAQVPGVRAVDTDMNLERFYVRYYPYGYYPYAYYPYFGPHAFAPHAWHAPIGAERMAQIEEQRRDNR